jgi:radical SAM superfamily enzyme YgiQ (UPF0313 family)
MARVVFIQNPWFEFLGPMYISAALKANGHDCDLYIGNSAGDFLLELWRNKPDLLAFSVMTGMHKWVLEVASQLKQELNCPVILGGPHPTFFPEVHYQPQVDYICRGEGEAAMVELANALDSHGNTGDILNIWSKDAKGRSIENELRPLVDDLDSLPASDRNLYSRYPALHNDPVLMLIASRGCPYRCTFCFNHKMAELYRGKGPYVRHRSPESLLAEIDHLRRTRRISCFYFSDDTFALDKKWLKSFLPVYGKEIRIPFQCLVRINQLDEEIVSLLHENGCRAIFFGIESGDESIRNDMLEKDIRDDQIRKGASLLKRYDLKFRTYNMVGFPGETLKQAFKTVELNAEIGTDYPWCSIFMPYPGTRLEEYARTKGYLPPNHASGDLASSFHITSLLENPDRSQLINLHKFFQTAVLFPKALPLIKRLIKLPPNFLFQLWFSFMYFLIYIKSEGRPFWSTAELALRNARFFRKS